MNWLLFSLKLLISLQKSAIDDLSVSDHLGRSQFYICPYWNTWNIHTSSQPHNIRFLNVWFSSKYCLISLRWLLAHSVTLLWAYQNTTSFKSHLNYLLLQNSKYSYIILCWVGYLMVLQVCGLPCNERVNLTLSDYRFCPLWSVADCVETIAYIYKCVLLSWLLKCS